MAPSEPGVIDAPGAFGSACAGDGRPSIET
jgi:hypothetical protein